MRILAALALLAIAPSALLAQTLRGRLVESGTGEPIAGAFVLLYPATGDASPGEPALDADLTGPDGRFALSAPGAGRYRVRVDRIGYQSHLAGPFAVVGGDVVETPTLATPAEPIELPAITAAVEPGCDVDPRFSAQFDQVWEEARKALATALWSEREAVYRYTATTYRRVVEPSGRTVDSSERVRQGLRRDSPYLSLPIEDLEREGYVRFDSDTARYHAPDAQALLSDAFLEGHCFRLVQGEGADEGGWIGLAFEPIRGRRLFDIEGTIWIDWMTSELRRLDLRYTSLPHPWARFGADGRVEFERLPSGAWIVRRWWIRAPVVTLGPRREKGGGNGPGGRESHELVAYVVHGGETKLANEGGRTVPVRAAVAGSVMRATGEPFPGAVVSVGAAGSAEKGHEATTDGRGRFRIDGLPPGRYHITFRDERLAALGWRSPPLYVELTSDRPPEVTLVAPSEAGIARTLCSGGEASRGEEQRRAVITGIVRSAEEGLPLGGAPVAASWREGTRTTATAGDGRYVLCGIPSGGPVELRASSPGHGIRVVVDVPPGSRVTAFDLVLAPEERGSPR